MKSQFESRAASSTSSRVASGEPYAMFSWTVPAKRMGSWKTTPIRSRQDSGVKDRMSAIAKVSRQLCRCSEQAPLTCTVERYSPLVRIIKPAQKLFYRGLPTTARSPTDRQFTYPSHLWHLHQSNTRPPLDGKGYTLEHLHLFPTRIGEANVLEADRTVAFWRESGADSEGNDGGTIEQPEDSGSGTHT
jgi:hypothetical protein